MTERLKILFIQPVPFLFIDKGDIFTVFYDFDGKPYIKLKTKMKIFLTKKRDEMDYYKGFA